jgi:hypothetical protein
MGRLAKPGLGASVKAEEQHVANVQQIANEMSHPYPEDHTSRNSLRDDGMVATIQSKEQMQRSHTPSQATTVTMI